VAQIATNALTMLAVIAADENPSQSDLALAEYRVLAVHDSLVDRAIVSWPNTQIPLAVENDYTLLTALLLAPAFGKQGDPSQQPAAEARIKRIALVLQAQSIAAARVASVHDSLVAQGFVSWSVNLIPQAVGEEYISLVAIHLAPLFEVPADPKLIPAIEQRIRQYSVILSAADDAAQAVLDVHRRLAATGRVRWSIQDIPPAAEDAYMMLAADALAPNYGLPPIQGDVADAYRALAQIIALPTSGERVRVDYF
jgi:hypothetical protein